MNERIVISRLGGPEVLQRIEEPLPVPGPAEVRIRVEAAGVSFGDILQRRGLFFAGAPALPYTPGYDVAGTIDAVGIGVEGPKIGQNVIALTMFGGYAKYLCVPADLAVAVPAGLDPAELVALTLNYTTAYQMLFRAATVQRGQSILVYGASGGVGSAVLDLARDAGVRVAAAMSARWHETYRPLADLVFDERDSSSSALLDSFQTRGFDVAFDSLGGGHLWRTRRRVAQGGKLIAFGISGAVKPDGKNDRSQVLGLALLSLVSKIWNRPRFELYAIDQRIKTQRTEIHDDIRSVVGLLVEGRIHPRVGARFPLSDASRAHELLESRGNSGKIVLVP